MSKGFSQQKLVSQLPRGTRLDASGTFLDVKGSRNFCSKPIRITADEMYIDIVERGLRADGLSSKLGVKNSREYIAKLVDGLFQNDPRHDVVIDYFHSRRQRSHSTKTIYSTMTTDELKIMAEELIPARTDTLVKSCLTEMFANQHTKLENTVQVLEKLMEVFNELTPRCEIVCNHNFQTRGFFMDTLCQISSYINQLLLEVTGSNDETYQATNNIQPASHIGKDDETAAEILLSVGSTVQPATSHTKAKLQTKKKAVTPIVPTEDKGDVSKKEWVTVGIVDDSMQTKYLLVKTPKDMEGSIDADKLIEIINNPETVMFESEEDSKNFLSSQVEQTSTTSATEPENKDEKLSAIVTSESYIPNNSKQTMTTLEITLSPNPEQDVEEIPRKKMKKL